MNLRLIAAAVLALGLLGAGCSLIDEEPTPSASEVATPALGLMQPTDPVDLATYFGIGPGEVLHDQYGDYTQLKVVDPMKVLDFDDAVVSDEARSHYNDGDLWLQGNRALQYLVTVVMDSPLVYDDSAEAQELFWGIADNYLMSTGAFEEYFAERTDVGDFALVDDDRLEWRQAQGIVPAPYAEGVPRARILSMRLEAVDFQQRVFPGPEYAFHVRYARPVSNAAGEAAWEEIETWYTVTVGFNSEGKPGVVGVNFGGHSYVGQYVEGGHDGLPVATPTEDWSGARVDDGRGVSFPVAEGWSMESDIPEAEARGIDATSPDVPNAVWAYYRGLASGSEEPPYLVTRVDPPDDDPYKSAAAQAVIDADLPPQYFVADGGRSVRLELRGIAWCTVDLVPARDGGAFDAVWVTARDVLGWTHRADYYVEAGDGEATFQMIVNGLSSDPFSMGLSAAADADSAGPT